MFHYIKKVIGCLLILVMASSISFGLNQFTKVNALLKEIHFKIQDEIPADSNVLFYEDHIYIPLKFVSQKLNHTMDWNEKTQTITMNNSKPFLDFEDVNPSIGEEFVYGEILSIDKNKRILTIDQHIDDNSSPHYNIDVSKDAIIILQRNEKAMNIAFHDLKIGDVIGIVLTKNKVARGIILID
ncbi:hypothetical protein IZY60_07420 [Lutibacter sp. B2]|nr:hypothetical protein [Lutibacter sp. B2]